MRFLFLFFVSFLYFCKVSFADVNVVVITPKEGRYEKLGGELLEGVSIAINDINESGGLNNSKINLTHVDDQCDDALSISAAQMIALNSSKSDADKVSLVIGPYCSNAFEEVAKIYSNAGIFQIIPTTMGVNNFKHIHKGLVKLVGSKERQGRDFYKFYKENYPEKMVAVIYDSEDRDIVDVAAAIQAEFIKEDSKNSLVSFDYNKYDDVKKLADYVVESGARMAYILGDSEKIIDIFREIKQENKSFVIVVNKYQIPENYIEIMGELAENSYLISLPSLKDNPAFAEELVKLRLLGVEPEGLAVYGYSAIRLWEDLVEQEKTFDYSKLAKKLSKSSFETPWGEVMFNNGAPMDDINYAIYKFNDGKFEKVY